VLRSASQFLPDEPHALDSGRYARDYNEVKEIGSMTNSTRAQEQPDIARFWLASPSVIWNAAARKVVEARSLDLSSSARTFALMYLGAFGTWLQLLGIGLVDQGVRELRRDFNQPRSLPPSGTELPPLSRVSKVKTSQSLWSLAVGGLHLEVIGMLWLVLATIATSVPDGVAWMLRELAARLP
jgi:hypothetical protein